MRLAKFDINQQLKSEFNAFLNSNINFTELRALVIGKKAVPVVHSQLTAMLTEAKIADQNEASAALEQQAYDNQVTEDNVEKIQDDRDRRNDDETKDRLTRELAQKKADRTGLEQQMLVNEFIVQASNPAQPVVHQHPQNPPVVTTNLHTHMNSFEIKRQLEADISALTHCIIDIEQELTDIAKREKERDNRREKRESRLQARVEYAQKRQGIAPTLSSENQTKLLRNIKNKNQALEQQCIASTATALQVNYSVFLEQFEFYLNHNNNRPSQEIEALSKILQLIKHNITHEQEAATLQSRLRSTIVAIAQDKRNLELTQQRLDSLIQANPDLTAANEHLKSENEGLSASREQNIQTRNRLFYPALILTGVGILATIPLILTLVGAIPFFISPALLLALVITPPALLLAAGIGFSIATLVYAIKGMFNSSSITTNEETINNNLSRMDMNTRDMATIENQTIPDLKTGITNNERNKDELTILLTQTTKLAEQTFSQAKAIEIPQYSSSLLFGQANVHVHPSVSTTEQDYSPSAPPLELRS